MVGVSAPLQQPTGLLQPGGTQSAGQGLFESHLAKLAIKTENSTPQGAAFVADGGSRTHATVSCPKAFRVKYIKVFVLYLFILLCVEPSVFDSYACF